MRDIPSGSDNITLGETSEKLIFLCEQKKFFGVFMVGIRVLALATVKAMVVVSSIIQIHEAITFEIALSLLFSLHRQGGIPVANKWPKGTRFFFIFQC